MASGEDLDAASCISQPLYPFGGHRGWRQRVLRYFADGKILLIPTFELIRALFLHNKALVRAILQPAGLINLATPVEPGFHDKLQIDFTWGIELFLYQEMKQMVRDTYDIWAEVLQERANETRPKDKKKVNGQMELNFLPPSSARKASYTARPMK